MLKMGTRRFVDSPKKILTKFQLFLKDNRLNLGNQQNDRQSKVLKVTVLYFWFHFFRTNCML